MSKWLGTAQSVLSHLPIPMAPALRPLRECVGQGSDNMRVAIQNVLRRRIQGSFLATFSVPLVYDDFGLEPGLPSP